MKANWALAFATASVFGASGAAAEEAPVVELYKSATCGCCSRWAEHMRANGFEVRAHDVADVGAQRRRLGMSEGLSGCHTAVVHGYVIEGHVPAADVRRLLAERPTVLGLAVPNMPGGSPGMENVSAVSYEVLLVKQNGTVKNFARH